MSAKVWRVLHTADWHLGKLLHDHDRYEEHQRFLAFLSQTIQKNEIDVLILAGDIFDSTNPPSYALRLYYEFLAEIYHTTHCAIVVTSGNHDSPAHLEAPKAVLKALNIHVVGDLPQRLADLLIAIPNAEHPELMIAALPFLRDKDIRIGYLGQTQDEIRKCIQQGIQKRYCDIANLAAPFQQLGIPLLATGHLTVLGAHKSDSERDTIHIGGLGAVTAESFPEEFTYVALGHLHRPQQVGNRPHLRYAGSPIPLSFGEAQDKKEVRLLEFSAGKLICNQAYEIPVARLLYRLSTTLDNLESVLANFQPEISELAPWVELVIKEGFPIGNLQETIERLTAGKPYKVIKAVIDQEAFDEGLRANEGVNIDALGDLLGNPREVFVQRLDQLPDLPLNDRETLIVAFAELYDLVLEEQRPTHSITS